MGDLDPLLGSLGHPSHAISMGTAVFAGLTSVTDKQTDRQTDRQSDRPTVHARYRVGNNRPHLRTLYCDTA